MALKETPYALPLQLDGKVFTKATSCAADTCIISSYFETPSISWISTSSLVSAGDILVDVKYNGWQQKSPLRAEWPFAVSLFKKPGQSKTLCLFVYHLSEEAYRVIKVPSDSQVALMMGYEKAIVVLKDGFLMVPLFSTTVKGSTFFREPDLIAAQPAPLLLPALCKGKSDSLLLVAFNVIQLWKFDKQGNAKMVYKTKTTEFGYSEVAWYDSTIATVSEGGTKIHLFDIEQNDSGVELVQEVPVTKLFIEEEYILAGYADGSIKVFDREHRALLSRLNVSAVAHTSVAQQSTGPVAPIATLPNKISFLCRYGKFIVSAMLDPNEPDIDSKQLVVSIWPVKGQTLVQALKTKKIPGSVLFLNFVARDSTIYIVAQAKRHLEGFATATKQMAHGGALVLVTWVPPFKELQGAIIKWREINENLQTKMAQEVMDDILHQPSFFRALFSVKVDLEEAQKMTEAMFVSLKTKDQVLLELIDAAIEQEFVLRRLKKNALIDLSSQETEESNNAAPTTPRASDAMHIEIVDSESSNSTTKLVDLSSITKSSDKQENIYWPNDALTTNVVKRYLHETGHLFVFLSLSKALSVAVRPEVIEHKFSLPNPGKIAESSKEMLNCLFKVAALVVDGFIENNSRMTPGFLKILSKVHHQTQLERPDENEVRCLRKGAAKLFIDHFVIPHLHDPVGFLVLAKAPEGIQSNLRVVCQMLRVFCGLSKRRVDDPKYAGLISEYQSKFRNWFVSKLSESDPKTKLKDKEARKRATVSRGVALNPKAAGLIVAKFIMVHHNELLHALGGQTRGSAPDPVSAKIRSMNECLFLPIMQMMQKKGTKDTTLANSLEVFGKSTGTNPASSTASDSLSSESHEKSTDKPPSRTGMQQQIRSGSSDKSFDVRSSDSGISTPVDDTVSTGSTGSRNESPLVTKNSAKKKKRRSEPRTKQSSQVQMEQKKSSGSLTASGPVELSESDDEDDKPTDFVTRKVSAQVLGEVEVALPTGPIEPSPSNLIPIAKKTKQ